MPAISAILPIALKALRSPWLYLALLGLAVAYYRHDARSEKAARLTEHSTRMAERASYTAAQHEAEAKEANRNIRVATEQQRITTDVSTNYSARLANLRVRYDRLRNNQASGSPRGGQQVSSLSTAPSGTTATPDDELSWRYTASQQAEQLDALITWVTKQAAIDPNAP